MRSYSSPMWDLNSQSRLNSSKNTRKNMKNLLQRVTLIVILATAATQTLNEDGVCEIGFHLSENEHCQSNAENCYLYSSSTHSCTICENGFVLVPQSDEVYACIKFERGELSFTKMLVFFIPYSIAVIFAMVLMCKQCKKYSVCKKYG